MNSATEEFAKWIGKKPDFFQKLSEQREKLEQHPAVKQLRQDFPEAEVDHNSLYQLARSYDGCNKCPGLTDCPNALPGHHLVPAMDRNHGLSFRNVPCSLQIATDKQDSIKKKIRSHCVPDSVLNTRFEDLEKDQERIGAIKEVMKFCLSYDKGVHHGVYLYGAFGVGKSAIMGAAARELASRGVDVLMVFVPDWIEEMKAAIDTNQVDSKLTVLREASVLILDDIGAETVTPWVRDSILSPVLQYRMQKFPTLFTSNLTLSELRKHLTSARSKGEYTPDPLKAERIMERIEPFVTAIKVGGRNRRRS